MAIAFASLIEGVEIASNYITRNFSNPHKVANVILINFVGLVIILSLYTLNRYYAHPKQNYTNTINFIEKTRKPTDKVIAIHLAEKGIKYYRNKLKPPTVVDDYLYIRDFDTFSKALEKYNRRNIIIITTLHRAGEIENPKIFEIIRSHWSLRKKFKGTLGDGDMHVWYPISHNVVN